MALNNAQEGEAGGRVPAQPPARGHPAGWGGGTPLPGRGSWGLPRPIPGQAASRHAWAAVAGAGASLQGWILPAVPRAAGPGDPSELWGTTAVGQPPRPGSPPQRCWVCPGAGGACAAPKPLHPGAVPGARMQRGLREGNNLAARVHGRDKRLPGGCDTGRYSRTGARPCLLQHRAGTPRGRGSWWARGHVGRLLTQESQLSPKMFPKAPETC